LFHSSPACCKMSDFADELQQQVCLFELQQSVFKRLAFLGMPPAEVTKFGDWSLKLAQTGAQGRDVKMITKALSRHLGKPRADLFVKWLMVRIPELSNSEATLALPVEPSVAQPSSPACQGVQASQSLSNDQPGSPMNLGESTPACVQVTPAPVEKVQPIDGGSKPTRDETVDDKVPVPDLQPKAAEPEQSEPDDKQSSDSDAVISEAIVKVISKDGKTYYWDRVSNACIWDLPAGIIHKWVSHKSKEGRTYYSDSNGCSIWALPPLQSTPTPALPCCKVEAQKPPIQLQSSSQLLFIPDVGIVRTVSLPSVPPQELAASSGDLGPFEVVLQPETPCPGLSERAIPCPLRKRKLSHTTDEVSDQKMMTEVPASLVCEVASSRPSVAQAETPVDCFLSSLHKKKLGQASQRSSDQDKVAKLSAALAALRSETTTKQASAKKDRSQKPSDENEDPNELVMEKPRKPRNCLGMCAPRTGRDTQLRARSRSPNVSVKPARAVPKPMVEKKSIDQENVSERRQKQQMRAMIGGA